MNSVPPVPDPANQAPSPEGRPLPLGELKGLWFHRFHFDVHPKYSADMGVMRHAIAVSATVLRSPNGDGRQVHIGIRLTPDAGQEVCIYQADIEVIVLIEGFPPDTDQDLLDEHAIKLAGPLGISSIREQLLSVTGRTPFPKVLLPLFPMGLLLKAWADGKATQAKKAAE